MQHLLDKVFCVIVVFLLQSPGKLGYCAIKHEGLLESDVGDLCALFSFSYSTEKMTE